MRRSTKQFGVAQRNFSAFDATDDALTGDRLEIVDVGKLDFLLGGGGDDGGGQRMFARSFQCGGEAEELGFVGARPPGPRGAPPGARWLPVLVCLR